MVAATPFVGRADELAALERIVHNAISRRATTAAFLVGGPGSGKTRLLGEAAARIRVPSLVLAGHQSEREVPLAAASALFHELMRVPAEGERLAQLFDRGPRAGPLEPLRVFEATYRALRRFGPALLIVDDLQWADPRTIALQGRSHRRVVESDQPFAEQESMFIDAVRRGRSSRRSTASSSDADQATDPRGRPGRRRSLALVSTSPRMTATPGVAR